MSDTGSEMMEDLRLQITAMAIVPAITFLVTLCVPSTDYGGH